MYQSHKYTLEPYKGMSSRHICPQCRKKEFALYIDIESGEYLSDYVGRCNRESNCGYHVKPKEYFKEHNIIQTSFVSKDYKLAPPKRVSFIDKELFKASLKNYEQNSFVIFLQKKFGNKVTTQLIERYFIGTCKRWDMGTVFWQIDKFGRVRTGKMMLYDSNGKRVKKPYQHIDWAHNKQKEDFNLEQCLFGEHLLKDETKPIAIVESEKTAIISSVYLPQYIWVAVGGLSNLSEKKCKVLKGRNVVLFPDLGGFDKWEEKSKELQSFCNVSISKLLESVATEETIKKGYDIADYLLNFNPKDFQEKKQYKDLTKEERLKIGLKIFNVDDLKKLAQRIATNWTDYQLIIKKLINEGMTQDDAEDILDIMCIKNVLQVGDFAYRAN